MHTLAFFLLAFSTSAIAQTKVFCDPPMQDRGFTLPAHPCNGLYKVFAPGESGIVCDDLKTVGTHATCDSIGQGYKDDWRGSWRCTSDAVCGDGNSFSAITLTERLAKGCRFTKRV
jgi:hypothetical protein